MTSPGTTGLSSSFEKTIAELREKTRKPGPTPLEAYKRFRKLNEHRLRIAHLGGAGGREVCRRRSDVVDVMFRELADSIAGALGDRKGWGTLAVGAFGGYGRREMTPFSDVDVMFLTGDALPSATQQEFIRLLTTLLWDIGFKVGHSVRSIPQAVSQANADLMTKTAMIECRYLWGDRGLFARFRDEFEKHCINGREAEYINWRLLNQKEMHQRHGGSVFMQEPHVKCGVGGLRDVQHMYWIAYVKERAQSGSRLVELSILRDRERRQIEEAYDFLLRVRTQMHYIVGRPNDSLTLQLQGRVATVFEYPQKNMVRRCEAFMRDYYKHAKTIHLLTELAVGRMQMGMMTRRRSLLQIFRRPSRGEEFDGFVAKDGELFPQTREIFNEVPSRLMRAFQHAQVRRLSLSIELKDLIRRRLGLVNRTFQYARVNREIFLAILSRKGEVGRVLRAMHDTGFLGKYMPEFGALDCLVQHEFFHRYTADEHTLVCIEKLDSVLFSTDRKLAGYRSLFQNLEDAATLYLALLLHDTGKALNRRHHDEASAELARKVARRLQLTPERRRQLITLVDAHYTLSKTAQTRNLDDPVTIVEFAQVVQNRPNLDALMLLTLADGMGTSDQNWSDWKESLVWQLYWRTVEYLEEGPASFEIKEKDRRELFEAVSARLPKDYRPELEALFGQMPERYFRAFNADAIREHLKFFRGFFQALDELDGNPLMPIIKWIDRPEQAHTEVWLCGWDRPRLLERVAGAFVASGLNILSADVFTRTDNVALDIFRVCNLNRQPVSSEKERKRFAQWLEKGLESTDYDYTPHIPVEKGMQFYRLKQDIDMPTKVVVDSKAHPHFTLVEVQTPDRPGLLYELLRAFNEAGAWIESSRITTEKDVALDAFYITDHNRNKLTDPGSLQRLQKLIQHAAVGDPAAGLGS